MDINQFLGDHSGIISNARSLINIGANDGLWGDELHEHIIRDGAKIPNIVFVEPVPWYLDNCKKTFQHLSHCKYINAAITTSDGETDFIVIDPNHVHNVPEHVRGCSMIGTSYTTDCGTNLIASSEERTRIESLSLIIKVPTMTFDTLMRTVGLEEIDVLKCDAEGHDWKIIQQVDLDKHKPKLIFFEGMHLPFEDIETVIEPHFKQHDYDVFRIEGDIHPRIFGAVRKERG